MDKEAMILTGAGQIGMGIVRPLESVERLENDVLWIKYKINNQ